MTYLPICFLIIILPFLLGVNCIINNKLITVICVFLERDWLDWLLVAITLLSGSLLCSQCLMSYGFWVGRCRDLLTLPKRVMAGQGGRTEQPVYEEPYNSEVSN